MPYFNDFETPSGDSYSSDAELASKIGRFPPTITDIVGQEMYIERLMAHFCYYYPGSVPSILRERRLFVLYGKEGIGKTRVCLEFVKRIPREQISHVYWVDATSEQTMIESFAGFDVNKRNSVPVILSNIACSNANWLIIFDNSNEPPAILNKYFPPGGMGNILITSRKHIYRKSMVCSLGDAMEMKEISAEEQLMRTLCETFVNIFRSKSRYKTLLKYRGDEAQYVLDALRVILDYHNDLMSRKDFVYALVRLSKRSNLYPQCFTLKDVEYSGTPLTAGHFGEVWKGNYQNLNVCLKVVKAYENSDIEKLLKAYAREAIIWSQLSHANLLPFYGIYHLTDKNRRICLVSPWMENGNIVQYLQRCPNVNRVHLFSDVAHGVAYLHDQSIVHGDLKGANILITKSGRACLADFGLSSISDPEVMKWTSMQSTMNAGGTTRWQAPELVDPEDENAFTTKESDVYAFACVAYEIFTGNVPFYEVLRDSTVILKISRGEQPSRPDLESRSSASVFSRGLSVEIWNLMVKCWSRNATDRPTMRDIVNSSVIYRHLKPVKTWEDMSSVHFRREMESTYNQFSIHDAEMVLVLLNKLK